jgi:hypothetical protein
MKNNFLTKAKKEVKEILLTKEGWIAWFIANVITSLHWMILTVIGFITKDPKWYAYAASAWAIGLSPLVPLIIINVAIAIPLKNLLLKNKRVILLKGEKHGKGNT